MIDLPTPPIYVLAAAGLSSVLRLEGEYTSQYCYPLSVQARFVHCLSNPTKFEVLALTARDYESIYRADSHGIWGHSMIDLVFANILVDDASKIIESSIGSSLAAAHRILRRIKGVFPVLTARQLSSVTGLERSTRGRRRTWKAGSERGVTLVGKGL